MHSEHPSSQTAVRGVREVNAASCSPFVAAQHIVMIAWRCAWPLRGLTQPEIKASIPLTGVAMLVQKGSSNGSKRFAAAKPGQLRRRTRYFSCISQRTDGIMTSIEGTRSLRVSILIAAFVVTAAAGTAHATACGSGTYPFPYTDVAGVSDPFCPGIMEAYVLGVTRGTTATTFSPNDDVPRLQMTTFLQRSIDQGLKRSSRRMALGQWWTPKTAAGLKRVSLPGPGPASFCKSDGERIWVANGTNLLGIHASTGEVRANADPGDVFGAVVTLAGVLVADGNIIAVDATPRKFVSINPLLEAPFHSTIFSVSVNYQANNLAFDGDRIWTANFADGSISIVPILDGSSIGAGGAEIPGFVAPIDVVFDGVSMWVAEDTPANRLRKLNADGSIAQTVAVGAGPHYMSYDGANIWVPNFVGNSITVVQASTGAIVATIPTNPANRLSAPLQAAFDGERILVTNSGNDSVTLFRAADLSLIGNVQLPAGSIPFGACSDGINFWVTLRGTKELLKL